MCANEMLQELLGIIHGGDGARGPTDQWGKVGSESECDGAAEVKAVGLEHVKGCRGVRVPW